MKVLGTSVLLGLVVASPLSTQH